MAVLALDVVRLGYFQTKLLTSARRIFELRELSTYNRSYVGLWANSCVLMLLPTCKMPTFQIVSIHSCCFYGTAFFRFQMYIKGRARCYALAIISLSYCPHVAMTRQIFFRRTPLACTCFTIYVGCSSFSDVYIQHIGDLEC